MLDDRCAADVVEEIVMSNALFECLCMQINFLTPKGTKMKLLIKNVNSNDNQKIGLQLKWLKICLCYHMSVYARKIKETKLSLHLF